MQFIGQIELQKKKESLVHQVSSRAGNTEAAASMGVHIYKYIYMYLCVYIFRSDNSVRAEQNVFSI